jgi:hypothetical protein
MGMCENNAFLVKVEQRVGSAGVLARNDVSCGFRFFDRISRCAGAYIHD